MQYAVELYYDNETEKKLFDLAQKVADENLSTKFMECLMIQRRFLHRRL